MEKGLLFAWAGGEKAVHTIVVLNLKPEVEDL
jgi:hypothetical protein